MCQQPVRGACPALPCQAALQCQVTLPARSPPPRPCPLQGTVCQIAPINPSIFKGLDRPFPPTLFVHMAERDPSKAETVAAALGILRWVQGGGGKGLLGARHGTRRAGPPDESRGKCSECSGARVQGRTGRQ